MAAEINR